MTKPFNEFVEIKRKAQLEIRLAVTEILRRFEQQTGSNVHSVHFEFLDVGTVNKLSTYIVDSVRIVVQESEDV